MNTVYAKYKLKIMIQCNKLYINKNKYERKGCNIKCIIDNCKLNEYFLKKVNDKQVEIFDKIKESLESLELLESLPHTKPHTKFNTCISANTNESYDITDTLPNITLIDNHNIGFRYDYDEMDKIIKIKDSKKIISLNELSKMTNSEIITIEVELISYIFHHSMSNTMFFKLNIKNMTVVQKKKKDVIQIYNKYKIPKNIIIKNIIDILKTDRLEIKLKR
jgi:hypothetical protein